MKKSFLLSFIVLNIFLLHEIYALAETSTNYLKGKFYQSIENYFLVATEDMRDTRFKKTVILMLDNNEDSSWGIVINKPIGLIPLDRLIDISQDISNEEKELYKVNIPIFWGGPVDESQIIILHSHEYKSASTKSYKNISISRDYNILFDIAKGKGPKKSLVILGYSGWGSGQLEGEMERGGWTLSEVDVDIIFDEEVYIKWLNLYKKSFIRL